MSEPLNLDELGPLVGSFREEEPIDYGREERRGEAMRICERLPPFLRHVRRAEAENRIGDHRLREAARAWRMGDRGMILLGPTGVGKSHAAALVFKRLLGNGYTKGGAEWDFAIGLRWFSASALAQARREHPLGRGDAPEITTASHARLLVIDDAGWDREPQAISDVLAARYESGRPTIITTGLTSAELAKHYGAAVVRRFVESGGGAATIVDCFAPFGDQAEQERRYP